MYEELIEPFRMCFEFNSYLDFYFSDNKEKIISHYGKETFMKMEKLRDDFYKTDAAAVFPPDDIESKETKARTDFLKLYPDMCNEITDILVCDYLYNTYMH